MTSPIRRLALVMGVALTLSAGSALPASAKPLEQEHYSGNDAGTWDGCGPVYEYESSWRGLFKLKSGRAGDPTPYLSDNYSWETVITNPANGEWILEHGNALYKDLKITNLYGTVYRFIAQESGSPYTIEDSDGRKVGKDRGVLRYQFDVDTQGDADPENDVFIEGSDLLIADHGSHAVWHMTSDEYCTIVNDLLE